MLLIRSLSLFLVFLGISQKSAVGGEETRHSPDQKFDICEGETFRPQCPTNHVVVMKEASYGRMQVGKCLSPQANSHIGCNNDITPLLDKKCSGKSSCEVKVQARASMFASQSGCPPEIFKYMEVEYTCMKIFEAANHQCYLPLTVNVGRSPLHIGQNLVVEHNCEVLNLQAQPGQVINMDLLDFNTANINQRNPVQGCKTKFGDWKDLATDKTMELCGNGQRQVSIKQSEGHHLQLQLYSNLIGDMKFILSAKALGCEDVVPPAGAWARREDDMVVMGCHGASTSWQLKCDGSRWVGVIGNCSSTVLVHEPEEREELRGMTTNILIATVVSAAVVFCTVIIMCGIYCMKKWSMKETRDERRYMHEMTLARNTMIRPSEPTYALYDSIPTNTGARGCKMDGRMNNMATLPLVSGFDVEGRAMD